MSINGYDQYLENQVTTATPGRLVVMSFDAAIRFAKLAADKMREKKLEEQSANIRKAQNILLQLITSLDMNVDPQLVNNLDSLYRFMFDRLTQANIRDDAQALDQVTVLLTEMRQTWVEAELLVRSGGLTAVGARAA